MTSSPIVKIENLSHAYGAHAVLKDLTLSVSRREIFGVLGPNGSGKSTLFRILATFFPPTSGQAYVDGHDVRSAYKQIRRLIGVVFQAPSLDGKLTVCENIMHHGHLFGLKGRELSNRLQEVLERLGLESRQGDRVEKLSGGLKRRAELAKALLHRPGILIMDEPSTGLDPGARIDLWKYLGHLRDTEDVTILVTTHLMEEAEQCSRVAIINEGEIAALGDAQTLKQEVGKEVVLIKADNVERLKQDIEREAGTEALLSGDSLQIEHDQGHQIVARLMERFGSELDAVTVRKPTLEDVFIHKTGHKFWNGAKKEMSATATR